MTKRNKNIPCLLCLFIGVLVFPAMAGAKVTGRIAVLDLVAKGVKKSVASNLTDVLATEVARVTKRQVSSGEELRAIFRQKKQQMLLGQCVEGECLRKLASYLDTGEMLSGSVGIIGRIKLISLQRIRQKDMKVLGRTTVQVAGDISKITTALRGAVRELYGLGSTIRLWNQAEGAVLTLDGVPVGITPVDKVAVPHGGDVRIAAEKAGYIPWSSTVSIQPGETMLVKMDLVNIVDLDREASRRRIGGWSTLSGGALLAVGSLGAWVLAQGLANEYNKLDSRRTSTKQFDSKEKEIDKTLWVARGLGAFAALAGAMGGWLLAHNPAADRLEYWDKQAWNLKTNIDVTMLALDISYRW